MPTLLQAIEQLNIAEITRLIGDKIDLNKPCSNGELPLKIMIRKVFDRSLDLNKEYEKCLQIIGMFLEAGANVKDITIDNKNILYFLSGQRDWFPFLDKSDLETLSNKVKSEDIAKKIIEMILRKQHMLDLNEKDELGRTIFLNALSHGNTEIAKLLMTHGADITLKDKQGNTALHLSGQKDVEFFKLLLNKDIDVNAVDGRGLTILDVINNPDLILALLNKGAKATHLDIFDFFRTAQISNHSELIEYLFSNGLITFINKHGQNALFYADSCELLRRLLQSGVTITVSATGGSPVIIHILRNLNRSEELLKRLEIFREYKADFSVKDKEGRSLLQNTLYADKAVFNALLEVVPVDSQDIKGNTVMHDAANAFLCDKMELLIAHNAKCTLRNEEGLLAIEKFSFILIAFQKDISAETCANVLLNLLKVLPNNILPKNAIDLLLIAIHCNSITIIENLFKRKASLTAKTEQCGYNAIEYAVHANKMDIFNWMLKEIIQDPNKESIFKRLLVIAVRHYRCEIIKILLNLGVDVNFRNDKGETILSSFIQSLDVRLSNGYVNEEEQHVAINETFKALIETNIDINLCNVSPSSPHTALDELLHASRATKFRWQYILILLKRDAKLPNNLSSIILLTSLAVEHNDIEIIELIIKKCPSEIWKQEILFFVAGKLIKQGDTKSLDKLHNLGLLFNKPLRGYLSQGFHRSLYDEVLNPPQTISSEPAAKELQPETHTESLLSYLLLNDNSCHYPHRHYGFSLLHIAANRGFLSVVNILLAAPFKYDVNSTAVSSEVSELVTPLQLAVKKNHVEIARVLLANNADPLIINKNKQTLLHVACDNGSIAMTELLLKTAIDKDALQVKQLFMNEQKLSAIHYAALYKDKVVAENLVIVLLNNNVKVNAILLAFMIQNQFSATTITRVIKLLTKNEIFEHRLLHFAAKSGNLTACQILMLHHPELLTTQNDKGYYPLHIATKAGCENIFKYFMSVKADIAVRDYEGYDVISHAVCNDTIQNLDLPSNSINLKEIHLLRAQLVESQEFKDADENSLFLLMQYCYKLISLFKSANRALEYISKYQNTSSKQPIHDLCLFQLPSVQSATLSTWAQDEWLKLIMKYGTEVAQYLHFAPKIEFILKRMPHDLDEIKKIAAQIKYNRESEHIKLAELFIEHRIPEEAFNRVLNNFKLKAGDFIPEIFIDGKEFNEARFYLKKLSANDLRGYVLGSYTHCCQHVGAAGEVCAMHGMTSPYGGFYVVFKKPNPKELDKKLKIIQLMQKATNDDEFLKNFTEQAQREKYRNLLKEAGSLKQLHDNLNAEYKLACDNDEIVAQIWAWISLNNSLVLDSWERLRQEDDRLCQPFIDRLANMALKDTNINCVLLGKGGQTPDNLNYKTISNAEYPKDYYNYRDSQEQYLIKAKKDIEIQPSSSATTVLSQGLGMFGHKSELKAPDYKREEIDILLRESLASNKRVTLLNAVDICDVQLDEAISKLKLFKDTILTDPDVVTVCILPILTLDKLWSVLIIEKGINLFDSSMKNWIASTYIDLSAKSFPYQLNKLLFDSGMQQSAHYMDSCRVVFNNNPQVSGAWLVENLKIFAVEHDFIITLLDDLSLKNTKELHHATLENGSRNSKQLSFEPK